MRWFILNNSGCYNCKNRVVGCHSTCEKYEQYKQYLQRIKDKKEEEHKIYANHKRSKVYGRKK